MRRDPSSVEPAPKPDYFDVFDQVCEAAGVGAGAERIGVLLALPDDTRQRVWRDVAARVGDDGATP
jgi:hypothetical protein